MALITGFINLILICLLIYLLFTKSRDAPLSKLFFPAVLLKILSGISIGLIYFYYYGGGDTLNFFHDAALLSEIAKTSPSYYLQILLGNEISSIHEEGFIYYDQHRAFFTAKVLSLFTLITYNNYWLSGIYFSLFSFAGMWYLANNLVSFFPSTKHAAALAFVLFPSVLIWSSGVMKESIIMGCLGFLTGYFLMCIRGTRKIKLLHVLLVLFCLFFLWKLKYYYIAVLLPIVLAASVSLGIAARKWLTRPQVLLIWAATFLLSITIASFLYPTLNFSQVLFFIVESHDAIYAASKPENLVHFSNLNESLNSFLKNLPLALFSGLFRPGIWEAHTFFQWVTAIENTILVILTTVSLFKMKTSKDRKVFILLFSTIMFIVILATMMAFSSPNFGTLMRYKIGFLPFLVYLACIPHPFLRKLSLKF